MKIRLLSKAPMAQHSSLEPNIWSSDHLRPEVAIAIKNIAEELYDFFDLPADLVQDLKFTGSLANYNYTKYSDIDLHLVVDFMDISDNTEMVKKFFDAKRRLWNQKHKITIKGYEVEAYVENMGERHISSGTYSVLDGDWIKKPSPIKPRIDSLALNLKIDALKDSVESAIKSEDLGMLEALKEKITKMRRCGLEKGGEYSIENLAFKKLRREGIIKKLYDAYTARYDQKYSLPEEVRRT
tara:strand:- start:333 stop:1052 length:720 start_codon:yes stop_codon:yes gene_type:complete